ncbi:MAG: hypothetical protein ACF8AM_16430 [Rhodopirellula sp. JB055]|uniref:hypothetical protein n=1 Tax=Rhodopirellula sp. JB055 TaxID=3342846 RepID=UPI00370CD8C4
MRTTSETQSATNVAARVAGEDIQKGDFITVLSEIFEVPSFLWNCADVSLSPDEPVRTRYLSTANGTPYKVTVVCLPFVYAKRPRGSIVCFDIRRHEMVRLDRESGQSIWKLLKKKKK